MTVRDAVDVLVSVVARLIVEVQHKVFLLVDVPHPAAANQRLVSISKVADLSVIGK